MPCVYLKQTQKSTALSLKNTKKGRILLMQVQSPLKALNPVFTYKLVYRTAF